MSVTNRLGDTNKFHLPVVCLLSFAINILNWPITA